MKKVGIITLHCANNYGAAIQSCGLFFALKNAGYDPIIIDYRFMGVVIPDLIRILPVTLNPKVIIQGMLTIHDRLVRLNKFSSFRSDKMKLSHKYYTNSQLRTSNPECDVFICGSDQIWNPIITFGVRPAFYLDFAKPGKKRLSYAASFGIENIPGVFSKAIGKFLRGIDAISVREQYGIPLVKKFSGKEAVSLIDPAFLIEKKHWETLARNQGKNEKYILVYMMQKNTSIYQVAKKLKEETGLKIIDISRYGFKKEGVDECIVNAGPQDFIEYIKNAQYVCTNSFHGMALAIVFEKPFMVSETSNFKGRIGNLLSLLNLDRQLINDATATSGNLARQFNWDVSSTKNLIESERKKGLQFLKQNIG